jgi:hypothetical protein
MPLSDSRVREIQKALEGVDYHYGEAAIRKVADAVLEIAAEHLEGLCSPGEGQPCCGGSENFYGCGLCDAALSIRKLKGGGV